MEETLQTYFDSPERSTPETIEQEAAHLATKKLVTSILEGFPELAVILNENRQIIAANNKAIAGFRKKNFDDLKGKRIGEAISCIHSEEMGKEGCGTSKFCAECGAAKAIKFSRENLLQKIEECRITSDLNSREEAFEFRVFASPIEIDEKRYTLFAINDISSEKRREILERIFFHDVLNTASVVNNFALLLEDADKNDFAEILPPLIDSSDQLIQEIQTQRDLKSAENGNLLVLLDPFSINNILRQVYSQYVNHNLTKGKKFKLTELDVDKNVITDKRLVTRSLGNLVKNAIEASKEGEEIKLYANCDESYVTFSVQNQMVIPEVIQLQIFKRSFSTKGGSGRGIGTYSVKLLVEQYLGGKVFFSSNKATGTIFSLQIPFK